MKGKKLLSLLLAIVMIAGFMVTPAFAADSADLEISSVNWEDKGTTIDVGVELGGTADDEDTNIVVAITATNTSLVLEDAIASKTGIVASDTTIATITGLTKPSAEGTYYVWAKVVASDTSLVSAKPLVISAVEPVEPGEEEEEVFDHNIVADGAQFKISATIEKAAVNPDAVDYAALATPFSIDLAAETLEYLLPEGTSIAAYSVNGGGKWTAKALSAGDISKLLNKECELWLATSFNSKAKKPTEGVLKVDEVKDTDGKVTTEGVDAVIGATVIKFPKIAARPKATKMAINYGIANYADNTGETTGQWVLTAKNATDVDAAALAAVQIAPATADGKKPENDTWGRFKAGQGINIKSTKAGDKPAKTVYLVRTAPVADSATGNYTPASKPYKVTASGQLAAPKLKADYKKEIIKPKAGMIVGVDLATSTAITYAKGDAAIKDGFNISAILTLDDTFVNAMTLATAKKPASAVQEITLAPRARLDDAAIAFNKAKLSMGKGYEVFDSGKNKYGSAKIAAKQASLARVRIKADAKASKDGTGYEGNAASADGTINISWGKDSKDKDIITDANLVGPDYKDGKYVMYVVSGNVMPATATSIDVVFGVKNAFDGSKFTTDETSFTYASPGTSLTASYSSVDTVTVNGLTLPKLTVKDVPVGELEIKTAATLDAPTPTSIIKVNVTKADKDDAGQVADVKAALEAPGALKPAAVESYATQTSAEAAVKLVAETLKGSTTLTYTFSSYSSINAPANGSIDVVIGIKKGDAVATTTSITVVLPYLNPVDLASVTSVKTALDGAAIVATNSSIATDTSLDTIKPLVEAAIEAFLTEESVDTTGITLDYTFTDYVNVTDASNGSIKVVVTITKGNAVLDTNKLTIVLNPDEA